MPSLDVGWLSLILNLIIQDVIGRIQAANPKTNLAHVLNTLGMNSNVFISIVFLLSILPIRMASGSGKPVDELMQTCQDVFESVDVGETDISFRPKYRMMVELNNSHGSTVTTPGEVFKIPVGFRSIIFYEHNMTFELENDVAHGKLHARVGSFPHRGPHRIYDCEAQFKNGTISAIPGTATIQLLKGGFWFSVIETIRGQSVLVLVGVFAILITTLVFVLRRRNSPLRKARANPGCHSKDQFGPTP